MWVNKRVLNEKSHFVQFTQMKRRFVIVSHNTVSEIDFLIFTFSFVQSIRRLLGNVKNVINRFYNNLKKNYLWTVLFNRLLVWINLNHTKRIQSRRRELCAHIIFSMLSPSAINKINDFNCYQKQLNRVFKLFKLYRNKRDAHCRRFSRKTLIDWTKNLCARPCCTSKNVEYVPLVTSLGWTICPV